ncbi:hypothetical protein FJZ28_02450 [Candidatus Peregrinibacteria bacterium]|nr:hypothetical protein [Candidatus Peregrinibacteria bacterium]
METDGLPSAIVMIICTFFKVLMTPFYSMTLGKRTFHFRGKDYRYFCHWYNTTFDNERSIEIAIAADLMRSSSGRTLEVGNVLSHYISGHWDILDKYEKGKSVLNQDIIDFESQTKYDLIISVSTLEHVGFDEKQRDPEKFTAAIRKLQSVLAPGGRFFFTIPIGYNPDAVIRLERDNLVAKKHYFERTAKHQWEETTADRALSRQFSTPYSFANALIICLDGEWA